MIRSMTAFAGIEQAFDGWLLAYEIRSVNHRHLDLSLRLPEVLRFLEPDIRSRIAAAVRRGRVECTLILRKTEEGEAAIRLNQALVAQILSAARQVEALYDGPLASFDAIQVLQWPGALHERETDREKLGTEALGLLNQALAKLVAGRESEGCQLGGLIRQRSLKLRVFVAAAQERVPEVLQGIRAKVLARLGEITASPDSDRLEQELVYLAQKLDVSEELDRLSAHIDEVLRVLDQDEPIGRRLDFLMQELNREANTLASKSADPETTRISVEMKVLIEQMREQVQNIE